MALSDNLIEQHRIAACDSGPLHFSAAMRFARAIEAEARKQDEALIRQMRNALYALPLPYTSETRAALQAGNEWLDAAIAERARLAPPAP